MLSCRFFPAGQNSYASCVPVSNRRRNESAFGCRSSHILLKSIPILFFCKPGNHLIFITLPMQWTEIGADPLGIGIYLDRYEKWISHRLIEHQAAALNTDCKKDRCEWAANENWKISRNHEKAETTKKDRSVNGEKLIDKRLLVIIATFRALQLISGDLEL